MVAEGAEPEAACGPRAVSLPLPLQRLPAVAGFSPPPAAHLVVHGVPPEGRLVLLTQHREHRQLPPGTGQSAA